MTPGMPEEDLPTIDPLEAGSMTIEQSSQNMKIKQRFENFTIRGLSSAAITDFK